MKILVVGAGGREHALAWKIAQSPLCRQLFVAPGNGGTEGWNVPIAANDVAALTRFAKERRVDLTVIGPEEPLTLGLADALRAEGLAVFGPGQAAARLEGSKAFAKEVLAAAGAPTARCRVFTDQAAALAYAEKAAPVVIKADGLAAGKGVIVAATAEEARRAVRDIMGGGFGAAGATVLAEEYLTGPEVSLLCFCDGETALPMVAAQDHKRAFDGDKGPNTGGMGVCAPPPVWTPALEAETLERIIRPVLAEMRRRGAPFTGTLFAGLMLTADGPKALEFNARFGDPETQALMLLLESDLVPLLLACAAGDLSGTRAVWRPGAAVCVVMAAPGYPGAYEKNIPLTLPRELPEDTAIFHAGTAWRDDDALLSAGGRVLGVTARGGDLAAARARAYALTESIGFPGARYRRDI